MYTSIYQEMQRMHGPVSYENGGDEKVNITA